MDYRVSDLKNFARAAQFSTISNAAEIIGMTQPSLSQSIKRLESDLGVTLFFRSKNGINLTPDGKTIYIQAKEVLRSLETIQLSSRSDKLFLERRITIGCHPVIGSYTLPESLALLKGRCPDFKVDIVHSSSRSIQKLVQDGRVDFGIVVNPNRVPDIIIREVAVDQIFIWTKSSSIASLNKVICNLDIFQTQYILKKWKKSSFDLINSENFELITRLTGQDLWLWNYP